MYCVLTTHEIEVFILLIVFSGVKIVSFFLNLQPELVDRLVVEETTVRNPYPKEVLTFQMMFKVARRISDFPKTMSEKQIRTFLSNHAANALQGVSLFFSCKRDLTLNFSSFIRNVTALGSIHTQKLLFYKL